MKITRLFKITEAPKAQIHELVSLLKNRPEYLIYPKGDTGRLNLKVEDGDPDVEVFETYCKTHGIRFAAYRARKYSKEEWDTAEFLLMKTEAAIIDPEGTKYTNEGACPKCGVGWRQVGPLVMPLRKVAKKKIFLIHSKDDWEWVVSDEVVELLQGFTGFRLGEMRDSKNPDVPATGFHQLIIENYLPRMATMTNFVENGWKRCECNRAGWNLIDEKFYEHTALQNAKDFNLTIERWFGGGTSGVHWAIVSQKVRQKLKKLCVFDPVHIIETDPGDKYKFDLPLDAPGCVVEGVNQ